MAKISREEVLKIAKISALEVHEHEIESLQKQLESVLSYAERVQEVSAEQQEPSVQNVNVFRDDLVQSADASAILKRAPEREEDFFVVPAIIEDK
jgi:aspartyl-tRNA(Asn)/glutamyl-tRNA(Gln) amidotransferase subunit C